MPGTIKLRVALALARTLGAEVRPVNRTGEVDIISPTGRRVRHNARKKDANMALLLLIKELQNKKYGGK